MKKPVLHLEHWQRELNVLQFCCVISAMASPPQSPPTEHDPVSVVSEVFLMSQINPLAVLHALFPHLQSALFGVIPFVMLHGDRV